MDDQKVFEQNVLKAQMERILSHETLDWDIMGLDGVTVMASLMSFSEHDFNKAVSNFFNKAEKEFGFKRPDDWRSFYDKISKVVYDIDNNGAYQNLSTKTKQLRKAVLILATLADAFEVIEKAELK